MIDGRRVIAVVPARAGSKAIENKNIRELSGRPLVAWPILVAQRTALIDRIIVSTDGDDIAAIAREYGAEVYHRDSKLATDTATVIDTLRDLTDRLLAEGEDPEVMVLLEATSPFRMPDDITACLNRLVAEELDSIATFADAALNPNRAWTIEGGVPRTFISDSVPWLPRQTLPPAWQLTGTVYAFNPQTLPSDSPSILYGRMGAEIVDEWSAVDIDTEIDLKVANAIFGSSKLATLN